MTTKAFIFYVEEDDIYVTVTINSKKYWDSTKCIRDHYTDEELEILQPVLDSIGLIEAEDSYYEVECSEELNADSVRDILLAAGLQEDEEFDDFMRDE